MAPPHGTPGAEPDDVRLGAQILPIARGAAEAAATLVHDERPESLRVEQKSSATDHVTQMDRAAEAEIRRIIAEHRPHDAVVGEEEGGGEGGDGVVTWWIDPIDGTTNYVYDHPGYAVSVAAARGERTLAGVVADPTHRRTYQASVGSGATCEGRTLSLGEPPPLDRMLVATGFGYDPSRRAAQGAVVARLLPRVRDIRRVGAASLDLCSVAAGRVDAYYEAGLSRWDMEAGVLVAREAGAVVEAIEGGPPRPGSVLACHPARISELRAVLLECGATGT